MSMAHQTAAILVIGNEVLSGRTREANAYYAAGKLFNRGCRLSEVAIVPDEADAIISTLNRLRTQFDAVITSGGIGPTHDDITMESIAEAFGVELIEHSYIVQAMTDHYGEEGMNEGRRRMSRVPQGAKLIRCDKTIAPGARIGNVYILAGVPYIFESQLDSILDDFGDTPYQRIEIEVALAESIFANQLTAIQQQFDDVEIGSYPGRCGPNPCGKICLSSQDKLRLNEAVDSVNSMLKAISN
ncbi:molybdenum cofactor synthesis domain-containing protein [Mariprofundus ferrinatatus]|uniref:Molybdenum cofactor synthesis domain-containing protein n=2 Tax=Mariprofundus ferrinatatus TaxID=1921087 RepID=A0A2K8L8J4_9PROT|nr:molybdenum cofactor synthesis domain-containing protein [Mariprofundus ferrinatatus]